MTYFKLYLIVLKISFVSFGGAYSIWALLENDLVRDCKAITPSPEKSLSVCREDYLAVLGISEILPGPQVNPISLTAHRGWGVLGMLAIMAALITPGLLLIPVIHRTYARLQQGIFFRLFIAGAILATVAVLISFIMRLFGSLVTGLNYQGLLAMALILFSFWATYKSKFNSLVLVTACGVAGYFFL